MAIVIAPLVYDKLPRGILKLFFFLRSQATLPGKEGKSLLEQICLFMVASKQHHAYP